MRSNDTLVDTPFQLISGFFHVNQGILCSEHAEQASSRGVLGGGGGGGNRLDSKCKRGYRFYLSKECMFTAQGPQVLCSRRFSTL